MPVTQLYVEGFDDQRVLNGLLSGRVAVAARGTKDELPHIVRRELNDGKIGLAYRWYSGKDLFGVLAGYFQTKGINNSADAMERVLVWLDTPAGASVALSQLPEWNNLASVLSR